jgi:hypothetical protein
MKVNAKALLISVVGSALEPPMYFRRPQVSAMRTCRRETVTVRDKPPVRYRDLRTGRFIKESEGFN